MARVDGMDVRSAARPWKKSVGFNGFARRGRKIVSCQG